MKRQLGLISGAAAAIVAPVLLAEMVALAQATPQMACTGCYLLAGALLPAAIGALVVGTLLIVRRMRWWSALAFGAVVPASCALLLPLAMGYPSIDAALLQSALWGAALGLASALAFWPFSTRSERIRANAATPESAT